jgi:hypothetical protein
MTSSPAFDNKTTATQVSKAYADKIKGKTGMQAKSSHLNTIFNL